MIFSPSNVSQHLPYASGLPTSPSAYSSGSGSETPIRRTISRQPSSADFQVERVPRVASRKSMGVFDNATEEIVLQNHVSRLLKSKARPCSVSGRIPLDPSHLNLFFRSKSGITHSLDFPIDPIFNTPPALDVLIAACRPHPTPDDVDDFLDRESLFYPPSLPLTSTLEISNHPILDAVRNTLFPTLPVGHFLTTVRDKLEVLVDGGRMGTQGRFLRNDGRVATIMVVLPVRFRGGALVVRDSEGNEERYLGRGGKTGEMEWVAFTDSCDYEMETVHKGCRLSISYAVFLKSYGPSGTDPLIQPSEAFLDKLSPVLNLSRGKKIAFNLSHDYQVNPGETLADSIVPLLKGGDSLLYHALKVYKLSPELHYSAGGYIWPGQSIVELFHDGTSHGKGGHMGRTPLSMLNGSSPTRRATSASRGTFGSAYGASEEDELRDMVEESGAISFVDADITLLNEPSLPLVVGKERVFFVSGGELEKLVLNVLMIVYIP